MIRNKTTVAVAAPVALCALLAGCAENWNFSDTFLTAVGLADEEPQRPQSQSPFQTTPASLTQGPSATPRSASATRSLSAVPTQPERHLGFAYCSPGVLFDGDANRVNENGVASRFVHYPEIAFPIKFDPKKQSVILNSQAYNAGGVADPQGRIGWREHKSANQAFPWYDTFCERAGGRDGAVTHFCPDASGAPVSGEGLVGVGHQGVDIRPPTVHNASTGAPDLRPVKSNPTGEPDVWMAVAPFDGTLDRVRGHQVRVVRADGVTALYQHLQPKDVRKLKRRQKVTKGQPLARVSNYLGESAPSPSTTPHLSVEFFETPGMEKRHFPIYTSLVAAYKRTLGVTGALTPTGDLTKDSYEIENCSTTF